MAEPANQPGAQAASAENVLEVENLTLDLMGRKPQPRLVNNLGFAVPRAGTVALIGESGCGKTITAMSLLGLLPRGVKVSGGTAKLDGIDLLSKSNRDMARVRGRQVGAVFQEPMSTLDPTMTVGEQVAESRRIHLGEGKKIALAKATELLDLVGIPNAAARLRAYPHELSGGMQQRVGIAAAIACEPSLLIADEPTTALDVTVQAEILELLNTLRAEQGLAILLITHDLGVVAEFCDDVVVMYAGGVAERADVVDLFNSPAHPYSQALIDAVPGSADPFSRLNSIAGRVPSAGSFPAGCRFAPRCKFAAPECSTDDVYREYERERTTCLRVISGELTKGDLR